MNSQSRLGHPGCNHCRLWNQTQATLGWGVCSGISIGVYTNKSEGPISAYVDADCEDELVKIMTFGEFYCANFEDE